MTTSSSSWTSMVAKVGVSFHSDVIVFVEPLLVGLGGNQTVFLPLVGFLVVTVFGILVGLVAISCGERLCYDGVYCILFLNCQFANFSYAISLRRVTKLE